MVYVGTGEVDLGRSSGRVGYFTCFGLRIFPIMSDGIFAYVREESGRVGIIDYIRRIAMMSEENKTYT